MLDRRALLLALPMGLLAASALPAQSSPQQILAQADRVRNPVPAFRVRNTVIEYRGGKQASLVELQLFSKLNPAEHQFRNLVRYAEPARDRGKVMLMDGQLLWFFDPASAATIRISPQQRLSGQVSNGDVLTANLSHDYIAQAATAEPVIDADKASHAAWRLTLAPSNPRAQYGKIEYWLDKDAFTPIKARFYTDSGRLLKIAYYRKFEKVLGGIRPTEVIILDGLDPQLVTKMLFDGFQPQDTSDRWFQKDYLPQLGAR